jgi:hypothetical protein
MDDSRFDTLVKWLATRRLTRVRTLRALTVGAVAAVTGLSLITEQAAAKGKGKGKKKRRKKPVCTCSTAGCTLQKVKKPSKVVAQNPRCNFAPTCPAQNPCAAGTAPPPPPPGSVAEAQATTCRGRCGTWPNNCGQSVTCPSCPVGQDCLPSGTCARSCTVAAECADCSVAGCVASIEGQTHCSRPVNPLVDFMACDDAPHCESSTVCPQGTQCVAILGARCCWTVAVCPP